MCKGNCGCGCGTSSFDGGLSGNSIGNIIGQEKRKKVYSNYGQDPTASSVAYAQDYGKAMAAQDDEEEAQAGNKKTDWGKTLNDGLGAFDKGVDIFGKLFSGKGGGSAPVSGGGEGGGGTSNQGSSSTAIIITVLVVIVVIGGFFMFIKKKKS